MVSPSELTAPPVASAPKPELRVLQVFSVLGVGGAETWLMALLRYFKEHADDLAVQVKFDVLLTGGEKGVFDEEAEALGARLFYVPFTRRTLPSFIRQFRQILAEGNYHAIHDHQDYIAGLHFLMAGSYLPPRRVAHVHNPPLHLKNYQTDLLRKFNSISGRNLLRRLATDVMGTSLQVLREYGFSRKRYPRINLDAAYCGFDVSGFFGDRERTRAAVRDEIGLPPTAKLLLFVGRLESGFDPALNQKNPVFAVNVANECIARDREVHLLMVGAGNRVGSELSRFLASGQLNKNVHLLGQRSDVSRLMLASDLLLFPSKGEGLGMVAVEAQAAGLRVLTSDVTPRECVVIDGLVHFKPIAHGSEAWADDVVKLLALPPTNLADCNRAAKLSPFSIDNSAATLLDLYLSRSK